MPEIPRTRDVNVLFKACNRCGETKPLERFVRNKECRDGRGSWCLDCFSKYISARAMVRQALLNETKNQPCVECGRSYPSWCMDLDHARGEKVRNVSDMLTYSEKRFLAEVAKCNVICACCHRVRSKASVPRTKIPELAAFQVKMATLKALPCLDCGDRFPPEAMDFDHVRGTKKYVVSCMWRHKWSSVLAEMAKCDLVCACCHRTRTQTRRTVNGDHAQPRR